MVRRSLFASALQIVENESISGESAPPALARLVPAAGGMRGQHDDLSAGRARFLPSTTAGPRAFLPNALRRPNRVLRCPQGRSVRATRTAGLLPSRHRLARPGLAVAPRALARTAAGDAGTPTVQRRYRLQRQCFTPEKRTVNVLGRRLPLGLKRRIRRTLRQIGIPL